MPTLKEMLAHHASGDELVILPAHYRYVEANRGEVTFTEEAMAYALQVWRGEFKHPRPGRFSPSGLGKCQRRSMLGFNGEPEIPPTVETADLMARGTRAHLFWQMEGISAGYLKNCELWAFDGERLGGSLDGQCVLDDGVFELKYMRGSMYYRRVVKDQQPVWEHLLQMEAYFRNTGTDRGSLIYQDSDGGTCHEFRIKSDPRVEEAMDEILANLNHHADHKTLPVILPDCEDKTGYTYNSCPQRKNCLRLHREGQ